MSRLYNHQNTGVNVVSGPVKSVAEDKLSAVITVQKYNDSTKKYEDKDVKVTALAPIEAAAGQVVTAVGYKVRGDIQATALSTENIYVEEEGLAILSGKVLFANTNKEIDKDGNPRLNKAGQPKKPHFDITVAVGDGAIERVTHTVAIYNFPEKKDENGLVTRAAQDNITRYEKLFAKFDRETNPIYVSIVTQPGNSWIRRSVGKDGREWENAMMSHLGFNSIDVTFLGGKAKEMAEKAVENDECWSAFLGAGGRILGVADYDNDEHRYSKDENMRALYLQPSFDYCKEMFLKDGWINTKEYVKTVLAEKQGTKQKEEDYER